MVRHQAVTKGLSLRQNLRSSWTFPETRAWLGLYRVPMRRTYMSNRFLTRAVLACLLSLAGMSLGCNKSPTGPTPPAGPESTAPAVSVTGISPAGGLSGGTVRIAGFGFLQGVTVTLDGLPATVTGVTSTAITAT